MTAVNPPTSHPRLCIERLLAEEADLTAVERFSRWHESAPLVRPTEAYRGLIPLSAPGPGEQFGFAVDLDACSGCKACVTACHALNGLEDEESWRSVGLLLPPPGPASRATAPRTNPETAPNPVPAGAFLAELARETRFDHAPGPQHVTTACHHCQDPACLHGCPVLAYDKDPITGIVRHLDDQCIGCSYCVMMCPYEVPRFSERLGIVRKCDMCQGRLADGEAPACAQACPNQAIRIDLVPTTPRAQSTDADAPIIPRARGEERDEALPPSLAPGSFAARSASPGAHWLAAAPDPAITRPATRYFSERPDRFALRAADESLVRPADGHAALVGMLTLTQAAAGGYLAVALTGSGARSPLGWTSLLLLHLGLLVSVAHLGQPLRAWRIFLGLRRSWLSREAMVLGAFGALALAGTWFESRGLLIATAWLGVAGVASSVMVYVATRRPFWSPGFTATRFGGTTLALGTSLALATGAVPGASAFGAWSATALGMLLTFLPDLAVRGMHPDLRSTALGRSARLLHGPLLPRVRARRLCAALGLILVADSWIHAWIGASSATLATALGAACLVVATLFERSLFFAASSPDRMPGGIVT